ncbi:putative tRNA(His) guanylyltransferase [Vanrija pseudolonga]|uniref:tRNA(His) guanylyltransferase n=1 Tax=Vanrija pseudolonga TaxID=143232 RepID=A0AAF1BJ17_9TREE|nr:putative tRNA(His) guanylyltransferase [Vanrija pseudolonga]
MAKSRFEYVKNYELPDPLLPNAHIVVRVDGRGFHKFSDAHNFEKPNDQRALDLMNAAARAVMDEFGDVVLAFGQSDEYSFLMRRSTNVYSRRRSKINSTVASIFTSAYVFNWAKYFPGAELLYPPTFDSRVVLYPGEKEVRDYFSWRQADSEWCGWAVDADGSGGPVHCLRRGGGVPMSPRHRLTPPPAHINNLYNTCFWALVHDGQTPREANRTLQGTNSKDKNELLFSRFGTNYNDIPPYFRKGSVLVRVDPNPVPVVLLEADDDADDDGDEDATPEAALASAVEKRLSVEAAAKANGEDASGPKQAGGSAMPTTEAAHAKKAKPYEGTTGEIVVLHEDIIRNPFWRARPWLLA